MTITAVPSRTKIIFSVAENDRVNCEILWRTGTCRSLENNFLRSFKFIRLQIRFEIGSESLVKPHHQFHCYEIGDGASKKLPTLNKINEEIET